jgi:hypothetical protein
MTLPSEYIKELIRTTSYSDDQIFTLVQKEFDLPDTKRGCVFWYRKRLEEK